MKKKIFLAIIASLLLISCGNLKKDQLSAKSNEKLKKIVSDELGQYEVNLYFDATNEENNPKIGEQSIFINNEELLGQYLMQTLIQGPAIKGSLKPILPKETKLISFAIKENIAIINLSKEAIVSMSPAKEKACMQSILETLSQLPSINKINIIIDNQMVESLGGNYDISKPFAKEDIDGLQK